MSERKNAVAAQIVTVDVRKLGLGMSHAFQGMAEVCASLGVPKEEMLGAVDEAEKNNSARDKSRKEGKRNGNEAAEPDTGLADPVADYGAAAVDGNVAVNDTDTQSTEKSNVSRTKSRSTMDDISSILTAKVKQKKIQSADARALLEKYGATSVSKLDPKYYDAFLEEASSL